MGGILYYWGRFRIKGREEVITCSHLVNSVKILCGILTSSPVQIQEFFIDKYESLEFHVSHHKQMVAMQL